MLRSSAIARILTLGALTLAAAGCDGGFGFRTDADLEAERREVWLERQAAEDALARQRAEIDRAERELALAQSQDAPPEWMADYRALLAEMQGTAATIQGAITDLDQRLASIPADASPLTQAVATVGHTAQVAAPVAGPWAPMVDNIGEILLGLAGVGGGAVAIRERKRRLAEAEARAQEQQRAAKSLRAIRRAKGQLDTIKLTDDDLDEIGLVDDDAECWIRERLQSPTGASR